jgi:hypothetical protein
LFAGYAGFRGLKVFAERADFLAVIPEVTAGNIKSGKGKILSFT